MTDRRFGTIHKFGTSTTFGPSDSNEVLSWDVSVDWTGAGFLTSTNEAGRMTGIQIKRGRQRLLKPSGQGFESIATGQAVITLTNQDGRYDAWNTNSPLYPNVTYNKEVIIRVRDMSDGTIYPLMRGIITNIIPQGYGGDATVVLYISDGLDYLRNNNARVALQTDIAPSDAMADILGYVGWKWGSDIDVSTDNIPFWWASGDKLAMSELEDLATSFLGYFFCDNTGQARFVKRTSVTGSVADYDQSEILADIGNPQPYEILRNVSRIKVHPRESVSSTTIYSLVGNAPSIANGETRVLFVNYTYNGQSVPAENVSISTFAANTQSDFGGTDETANCTATLYDFGNTAKVTIKNNSGGTVYISLELDGNPIYEPNVADVTYPSDPSTVSNPRELVFDLIWQQDVNVAIDISTVLGPFYAGLHPMPNIKVENRPSLQYLPDLFDTVSLTVNKLGIDGVSFRVSGIEHYSLNDNCQSMQTRLYLEPYPSADDYMVWGTSSVWDTDTIFGW